MLILYIRRDVLVFCERYTVGAQHHVAARLLRRSRYAVLMISIRRQQQRSPVRKSGPAHTTVTQRALPRVDQSVGSGWGGRRQIDDERIHPANDKRGGCCSQNLDTLASLSRTHQPRVADWNTRRKCYFFH